MTAMRAISPLPSIRPRPAAGDPGAAGPTAETEAAAAPVTPAAAARLDRLQEVVAVDLLTRGQVRSFEWLLSLWHVCPTAITHPRFPEIVAISQLLLPHEPLSSPANLALQARGLDTLIDMGLREPAHQLYRQLWIAVMAPHDAADAEGTPSARRSTASVPGEAAAADGVPPPPPPPPPPVARSDAKLRKRVADALIALAPPTEAGGQAILAVLNESRAALAREAAVLPADAFHRHLASLALTAYHVVRRLTSTYRAEGQLERVPPLWRDWLEQYAALVDDDDIRPAFLEAFWQLAEYHDEQRDVTATLAQLDRIAAALDAHVWPYIATALSLWRDLCLFQAKHHVSLFEMTPSATVHPPTAPLQQVADPAAATDASGKNGGAATAAAAPSPFVAEATALIERTQQLLAQLAEAQHAEAAAAAAATGDPDAASAGGLVPGLAAAPAAAAGSAHASRPYGPRALEERARQRWAALCVRLGRWADAERILAAELAALVAPPRAATSADRPATPRPAPTRDEARRQEQIRLQLAWVRTQLTLVAFRQSVGAFSTDPRPLMAWKMNGSGPLAAATARAALG
ncbi:hypothetical protein CXG81DRAFT_24650 [Caulochytrium protostelioides]|uniref:Uncharacterized protein n=1 Tax=Caulochytrium protostelioides TaxID=1555241 RepID=A0A4P9XBA7_9FUNG|nr:hypothetical protein CXG81DRAFT_24650 [Caulochytrium protostelioides]|eukprot:RKP02683.1 hypothetical protein CXG81DRAFT_24650 [Caulochytrium protostelioides]